MADGDGQEALKLAHAASNVYAFIQDQGLDPERGAEILMELVDHRLWIHCRASAPVHIKAVLEEERMSAITTRMPTYFADDKGCRVILEALRHACDSSCQAATAILAGCWQLGLQRSSPAQESELTKCFKILLRITQHTLSFVACECQTHEQICREAALEQLLHALLACWTKHASLRTTAHWSGK